jgi:hypothetical protein
MTQNKYNQFANNANTPRSSREAWGGVYRTRTQQADDRRQTRRTIVLWLVLVLIAVWIFGG